MTILALLLDLRISELQELGLITIDILVLIMFFLGYKTMKDEEIRELAEGGR
jgi:hypothetical protein